MTSLARIGMILPHRKDIAMTQYAAVIFVVLAAASLTLNAADAARSVESFDKEWRFARFGMQADASRIPEPGGASSSIVITASSEEAEKNHSATMAMDGDPGSRWCAANKNPAQWIQLDLGSPTELGGISIHWEFDLAYKFAVEGGDDGKNWKMLADKTQNAETAQPMKIALSGKMRFVRIRTTALPNAKWASIAEIVLTDAQGKAIENKKLAASGGPEAVAFDDSSWRPLSVPHDWGIEGPFRDDLENNTGKLPWRGIGWYRKHFTMPASDQGKRVFVDFDGAMAHARIWLNGQYVGTWPYGYNSFRMDLTPFLKIGENVLAVRLDTEHWDSRWYPGAGIYRHVWLVKTQPVHVGHWGTYITTPEITDASGKVKIAVTVDNQDGQPAKAAVRADIYELAADGSAGAKVASTPEAEVSLDANNSAKADLLAAVPNPKRWDIVTPANRYLARTVVTVGGKVVDEYDTTFGFRTLEFTPRDGFKLNGKRVEIRGVCNHHDLGALGSAMNTRALERQLEILKQMGCNAIRTSHNPPTPELLELADRMGFVVQVEAFDCWAVGKRSMDYNRLYAEWHKKDLQTMVHRDRNHPSVFMWSIGNEIHEQGGPEPAKSLRDIVHAEDPTRPVTAGCNNGNAGFNGFEHAVDIMGINYHLGNYAKFLAYKGHENKPVHGSETSSCVSSRGEYFFPVARGKASQVNFQVSSYDVDAPPWAYPPDDQFAALDKNPAFFGEFVWTGFDYLGEPTPYNNDVTNLLNFSDPNEKAEMQKKLTALGKLKVPSRSSYFGIVDLAGFPKDRFYSYQSRWRSELPMAHIFPHWNWPDRVGQVTPVHVYTSGDEAELFLNGKSLGRQKKEQYQYRLRWNDVVYQPGELKVVAYKGGKEWASDVVKTTGEPLALAMQADRAKIAADGADLAFITVRVADSEGLTVPRTHNLVKFAIDGPGEVVAVDNGDAASFEPFQASQRKAFNGMCLVIVRAKAGQSGEFTVKATSEGLKEASIRISAGAK